MKKRSTKSVILSRLEEARGSGRILSGAELASEAGVSRNAVWKAVRALRAEGYDISSVQSRGYVLGGHIDVLSGEEISSMSGVPVDVRVFDSIGSTNTYARDLDVGDGCILVVADEQTGGRGRRGRSFFSPKGSGIYMSFVFRPQFPTEQVTLVTAITAVIVRRELSRVTGRDFSIKWVNDMYLNGLKVSGILSEAVGSLETGSFDSVIIGIGINVFPSSIPPELEGIAGCVTDDTDPGFTRNEIIAAIEKGLYDAFAGKTDLDASRYLDEYREHCFIIGSEITVRSGRDEYRALVTGIGENFALLVRPLEGPYKGSTVALTAGEVSIGIGR
jgi:BirA family biotin operon repressor/biotin-[acetyl-CoA-carboxylase] ligase